MAACFTASWFIDGSLACLALVIFRWPAAVAGRGLSVKSHLPQLFHAFIDKRVHPVRGKARSRIDDMDRNRLGLELLQHVFEPAALPERCDLIRKKHPQPQPVDAAAQGAVSLIATESRCELIKKKYFLALSFIIF